MELETNKLTVDFKVEVADNLDEVIVFACNDVVVKDGRMTYTAYIDKEKLIDMFKRNTPTKVLLHEKLYGGPITDNIIYSQHKIDCCCPNCHRFLLSKTITYTWYPDGEQYEPNTQGAKDKHCRECGQALDWSDVEFEYTLDNDRKQIKVIYKNKEKENGTEKAPNENH